MAGGIYLMMKLSDREWEIFDFLEVFNIVDGYYNKKPPINLEINSNNIPFLAATKNNNGVTGFVNKSIVKKYDKVGNISSKDAKMRIYNGKSLAITNNGSVGNVYYQDTEFTCSHDITVLYLKNRELTKFIALFLNPLLRKSGSKYAYANKWRPKRMKKSKVLLPVDKKNNPDYDFMEQYIKEKYFNLKLQIKEKQKHEVNDWRELDEVEWEKFTISQLFNNQIGKNIDGNKIDKQSGRTPYITRKESNNGLDGFINDDYRSKEKLNLITRPVITIGNETAKPFVQNYNFYTGTKVNILTPLGTRNIFSTRFIAIMLEQQKSKYSYSFTINSRRLKKQIINLPTKNNQPDYEFMEQYMKRKENKILDRL